jgi:general secretion pathway protein E
MRQRAQAKGMKNMREDGQRWVDSGTTTLEELLRVTRD